MLTAARIFEQQPGKITPLRPPLNPAAFRDSMARLAGGVAIVACQDGQQPRGVLISSLTALSTEPPRVLFCIRKAASCHGALLRAAMCSVSILASDDLEEAQRFADTARAAERFASDGWQVGESGSPAFRHALVGLQGVISQRMDAGTHSVFILDVTASHRRDAEPLIYFDRDYRTLSADLASMGGGA